MKSNFTRLVEEVAAARKRRDARDAARPAADGSIAVDRFSPAQERQMRKAIDGLMANLRAVPNIQERPRVPEMAAPVPRTTPSDVLKKALALQAAGEISADQVALVEAKIHRLNDAGAWR